MTGFELSVLALGLFLKLATVTAVWLSNGYLDRYRSIKATVTGVGGAAMLSALLAVGTWSGIAGCEPWFTTTVAPIVLAVLVLGSSAFEARYNRQHGLRYPETEAKANEIILTDKIQFRATLALWAFWFWLNVFIKDF